MVRHATVSHRRRKTVKGAGGVLSTVLNRAIDLLPFELHIPGYRYCGPGTKLSQRLRRGDRGINQLDEACKTHDIAYSNYKDSDNRRRADIDLAAAAWKRFKATDSTTGEKAAALGVATIMGAKSKIGTGMKRRKSSSSRRNNKKRQCGSGKTGQGLKRRVKGAKRGGMLPLLPVFAGLSALGSLAGGAANIAKALAEAKRRKGDGLYLRPYKVGAGRRRKRNGKKKKNRYVCP